MTSAGSANPGTLGATKPARRLLAIALSAQDLAPPPTSSKGRDVDDEEVTARLELLDNSYSAGDLQG